MDAVATCVRTVAVTPRESHEAPIVGEDNAPSFKLRSHGSWRAGHRTLRNAP